MELFNIVLTIILVIGAIIGLIFIVRDRYQDFKNDLKDQFKCTELGYIKRIEELNAELVYLNNKMVDKASEGIRTYINIFEFDVVSIERDPRDKNQTIICYWKSDDKSKIKHFYLNISDKLHNELVDIYSSQINGPVLQEIGEEICPTTV